MKDLNELLHVGTIQNTVDWQAAWRGSLVMSELEQEHSWHEIQIAARAFEASEPRPEVILLPELSVPRARISDLRRIACSLNSVIIAGVDYRVGSVVDEYTEVWNEAVMIVPTAWGKRDRGADSRLVFLGKADPAREEQEALRANRGLFRADPILWVIETESAGNIGVTICSDLLDLERALVYRDRVDHIMVVAYNRDFNSFSHLAEAYARTVYCNVIICNTGHYGGSLAVSPYREPHRRILYQHSGSGLLAYQVVSLPVASLCKARRSDSGKDANFKAPPPRIHAGGGMKTSVELLP